MPPQTLPITIRFRTEHKPATPEHLAQVAANHFRPKGVKFIKEELVIEIWPQP